MESYGYVVLSWYSTRTCADNSAQLEGSLGIPTLHTHGKQTLRKTNSNPIARGRANHLGLLWRRGGLAAAERCRLCVLAADP